MKAAVLFLFLVSMVPSVARPEDSAMAASLVETTQTIMNGLVKSISWANPQKGTKSEIVVLDASKKKTSIVITPDTTVWDTQAKAILPETIVPRNHVNVTYSTTPEGINIGKSIKVLK